MQDDNTNSDSKQAANSTATRTESSASAGWKTEHDYQGVAVTPDAPHEIVADGGVRTRYILPSEGAILRDQDTGGPGGEPAPELVVVTDVHPETSAAGWTLPGRKGTTVADVNPDEPDAAPVVAVVYVEEALEVLGEWEDVDEVSDAVERDEVSEIYVPATRLATSGGSNE